MNLKELQTVASVRDYVSFVKQQGKQIALVPTMGCLHEGHLDIVSVRQASQNHDVVIVSIFVNPAQFAPHEDLNQYPRTLKEDLEKLSAISCSAVFCPNASEMYPSGITTHLQKQEGTFVEVKGKSEMLEGSVRPHFFRGVATVVSKLFNIVQPHAAFFGQKDVQQCIVLRQMVIDLHINLRIIVVPTSREKDGLAMSSRNRYLSEPERSIAPTFYEALQKGQKEWIQKKQIKDIFSADEIIENVEDFISSKHSNMTIDYISLNDFKTLDPLKEIQKHTGAILSGAIRIGTTRLIDNILLDCTL